MHIYLYLQIFFICICVFLLLFINSRLHFLLKICYINVKYSKILLHLNYNIVARHILLLYGLIYVKFNVL